MHLKGKEKHFWRSHFNIGNLADIPAELTGLRGIDDETDDEFLSLLISRISVIYTLYFKFTLITDEGVKHISKVQKLKHLTLREHDTITNVSVPYINKLIDLEFLDVLKTQIHLEDLSGLYDLQKLKELHVSSENTDREYLLEYVISMKEILPNCILYINYETYE